MRRRFVNFENLESVLTLVLFAVFAGCVLAVLNTGVTTYSAIVERGQDSYDQRALTHLVSTKLRQSEGKGRVTVTKEDGIDVLSLYEQLESNEFVTRIYCYDGWLCELFTFSDMPFKPEDGERLMEATCVGMAEKDGFVTLELLDSDKDPVSVKFSLRGDAHE